MTQDPNTVGRAEAENLGPNSQPDDAELARQEEVAHTMNLGPNDLDEDAHHEHHEHGHHHHDHDVKGSPDAEGRTPMGDGTYRDEDPHPADSLGDDSAEATLIEERESL